MNKISKLFQVLNTGYYRNKFLKMHVAASIEHKKLCNRINFNNIKVIIDIGANRGQFALMARHQSPKAEIISFEPLTEAARKYRSIFKNDPNNKLFEVAIGSEETEATIHISKADDSSSLLPISSLQTRLYPGTEEKETRRILIKPLEKVISAEQIHPTALLKIDVQGFEQQVLEGCEKYLDLFRYIYVECSFLELYVGQRKAHEIIRWLDGRGFTLDGIYNLDYDKNGRTIQGDFLFIKE